MLRNNNRPENKNDKEDGDILAGLLAIKLLLGREPASNHGAIGDGSGFDTLRSLSGLSLSALKTTIRSATLVDSSKTSYKDIDEYINNSQCHPHINIKMSKLIRLERIGENNFTDKNLYRMMLWHGTKKDRLAGILQNGFAPPSQTGLSSTSGLMYGNGVYFADRSSKSAQYCDSKIRGSKGYMLLCDVNLGKVYKCGKAHGEYTSAPVGFDTVKGNGKNHPNWQQNKKYYGSILPVGQTVESKRFETFPVQFNEYIVYDVSRILIKFLVEVDFV